MAINSEVELKFSNPDNFQLKFIPVESGDVVAQKIGALCEIVEIDVGDRKEMVLTDEYYDDRNRTLHAHGCTLRLRTRGERHVVTIKVAQETLPNHALHRLEDEFECGGAECREWLAEPSALAKRLQEKFGLTLEVELLIPVISVRNSRTSLCLRTRAGDYELSYDKFYFFDPRGGSYSEYFGEIEIESTGSISHDPQLRRLANAFSSLLNCVPSEMSKVERGRSWIEREPSSPEHVYTLAFDIVRYSERTADVQKQIIMKFNCLVKEAIRDARGEGEEERVLYIPTGDGMVLLFKDRPETLLPIVFDTQARLKDYLPTVGNAQKFVFRTGIHAGPVFKYSDVNENVNVAGNGINIAVRVMNIGADWHILATTEALEAIGNTSQRFKEYFMDIGKHRVKHGNVVRVYNVFDREGSFGNPSSALQS